jgi:hypothetical protein
MRAPAQHARPGNRIAHTCWKPGTLLTGCAMAATLLLLTSAAQQHAE